MVRDTVLHVITRKMRAVVIISALALGVRGANEYTATDFDAARAGKHAFVKFLAVRHPCVTPAPAGCHTLGLDSRW